jgi:hypothetical protein
LYYGAVPGWGTKLEGGKWWAERSGIVARGRDGFRTVSNSSECMTGKESSSRVSNSREHTTGKESSSSTSAHMDQGKSYVWGRDRAKSELRARLACIHSQR